MENQNIMDANFVPEEFQTPYDIVELPSQGLLYPNKKSKVKLEYLTALDENILSSPNISNNSSSMLDILLERKIKDLGFDHSELLVGDRLALLIYLRVTGFGEKYVQLVIDPKTKNLVEGEVDLSKLKSKQLKVKPDNSGLFDFILPESGKNIKFKLLNAKDEEIIESKNKQMRERFNSEENFTPILRLEQTIQSIDGETDKIKLSNTIKRLKILDVRNFNKYATSIEPGIDFETEARIQGGESVSCFLRISSSFFWPEL